MNLNYNNLIFTLDNVVALFSAVCSYLRFVVNRVLVNIVALTVIAFSFVVSNNVHAAAGDTITTTATVDYVIAGVPGSGSASASFVEDRIVNFFVTELNGGSAVPVISNMNDAIMQFSVTNTSNIAHDFLVTAVNTSPNPFAAPTENFDVLPGTIQVFVESGATPGYQAAQDTAVFIDELAVNASAVLYMLADMPAQLINDVAAMALIAQVAEGGAVGIEGAFINADDNSHTSPAGIFSNGGTVMPSGTSLSVVDSPLTMETVFNDPVGLNIEDISTASIQDVISNGQHSDAAAYQVMSPINIVKTVTVIDTLGGSDPHPGATLRYQLAITVAGNTAVDNLLIADNIPPNTTYSDASITLNGIAQTDANDVPVDYSRAIDITSKPVVSIEVDLSLGGTMVVAPSVTNIIIFEVTIN